MTDKIKIACAKCTGPLYQGMDGKKQNRPYYRETFQCLMCGAHYNKMSLLRGGAFNAALTEEELVHWTLRQRN